MQKFLGDNAKKTEKCFWCGSNDFVFVANRVDGIAVVSCVNCELMQVAESPEDLEDLYTEDYYNPTHKLQDVGYDAYYTLMNPLFLLWQSALIDVITDDSKKYTLLDVGCATGNLLEIIRQYNPNVTASGIDISDYAVEHCQKKDLDVSKAYIEKFNKNQFDIIVSLETLEHLDDLKTFIGGIRSCMENDGSFMFYVPSVARHELEADGNLDVRLRTNLEHLIYFTPEFFEKEFSKFFKQSVYIKEIVTKYGRSIVGLVTNDANAGSAYNHLFSLLTAEQPNTDRISAKTLENSIIMSAKFYSVENSETMAQKYSLKREANKSKIDMLRGIIEYHKGSLATSINYYLAYYEQNPKDLIALKVLLANEAEYNSLLLGEVGVLTNEVRRSENRNNSQQIKVISSALAGIAQKNIQRIRNLSKGRK